MQTAYAVTRFGTCAISAGSGAAGGCSGSVANPVMRGIGFGTVTGVTTTRTAGQQTQSRQPGRQLPLVSSSGQSLPQREPSSDADGIHNAKSSTKMEIRTRFTVPALA